MTTTFIISEAKLREFTDINNSVDTELIKNAVREAQDIHLQRIIGTKLYDKILSEIDANTLADPYLTLVNGYIQDFLLYAAYYEALEVVFMRSRNNGLLTPTGGENSINVDRTLFNQKRQSVENKMEYYAERLANYICEEEAQFPELNSNTKLYEQPADYSIQYRSPIVFNYKAKRGYHYQDAKRAGLRITDSRYNQFPWGSNVE